MTTKPLVATALAFCVGALSTGAAAAPMPAVPTTPRLEAGLTLQIYDIGQPIKKIRPIQSGQTPNVDVKIDTIDILNGGFYGLDKHFRVQVSGYLKVPQTGQYDFQLASDDGARLQINGTTVATDDGIHPFRSVQGRIELEAGFHRLVIDMFEHEGEERLKLQWMPPGANRFNLLPTSVLFTEAGVTRVTSPDTKRLRRQATSASKPGKPRPGDRMPLTGVHPGFVVEQARPSSFKPQVGAMAFLSNGMLAVTDFAPKNDAQFLDSNQAKLFVLENPTAQNPENIVVHEIADDLHAPMGAIDVDGALFIADSEGIYRFRDRDRDGVPEGRSRFARGWKFENYHHFTMGLVEQDGYLYSALSTAIGTNGAPVTSGRIIGTNGPNSAKRGTVFRVNLKTRRIEYIAGGFRTPNGLGTGPKGTLLLTDNQGAWKPTSRLDVVQEGKFYGYHSDTKVTTEAFPRGGKPTMFSDQPETPPAVWLPHGEVSLSPSTPLTIKEGIFEDQVLLGEFAAGGIRRVALEQIHGVWQGCVFRFTQGFEVGVLRLIEGPDGCYYIGGTGGGGNWKWKNTTFGLQRLRPVDGFGPTFEYHTITATQDGFEIRFTQPVDLAWLGNPANFRLSHHRYDPGPEYGGSKRDSRALAVTQAIPAPDGKSVLLSVPGRRPGYVVHFWSNPTARDGQSLWSTEAWYTLNTWPGEPTRGGGLAEVIVE